MKFRAVLSLLCVVWVALVAGCGAERRTTATGEPPAAMLSADDLALAAREDLVAGVPVSGTLEPGWQAHVTSPLDDVIEQVLVREGERVRRGQVLARFRLDAVRADAASTAARLKSARSDYERQQNLYREGAVALRDVESAEADWRAAQATQSQAAKRLADATVRAPGAGVVTVRNVQTGDRVSAGDPLFTVADTRRLEFEATVPGEFIRRVRVGATVVLQVSGIPAGAVRGQVARINTAVDPATRQVQVYVAIDNPDGLVPSGLFASGSIVTQEAASALAVPSTAVRTDSAGTFVLAIRNQRLARRPVTAGVRDAAKDRVEILAGVAEAETVLVGTAAGLVAGQRVQIAGIGR